MEPYRAQSAVASDTPSHSEPLPEIPKARSRTVRLVFLFALLALLIYALRQLGVNDPLFGSGIVYISIGFVAFFVVLVVYFARTAISLSAGNNDAIVLLNAGRVDEAAKRFEQLARQAKRLPSQRAVFIANLGVARIRMGEIDGAIENLRAAHESGWLYKGKDRALRGHALIGLATANGIKGNLTQAKRWQTLAHEHVSSDRRGALVLSDAFLAARNATFEEVEPICDAGWGAAESILGPFQMRALRLIRAFALSQRATDGSNTKQIESLIEGARPATTGEFDYLCQNWHEFRNFLVAHQFSNVATETAS